MKFINLILFFTLLTSFNAFGNQCFHLFEKKIFPIHLGEVQAKDTPIKTQCSGTCYFEASVEAIDRELLQNSANTLRINRPFLFFNWFSILISKLDFNNHDLRTQFKNTLEQSSFDYFQHFLKTGLQITYISDNQHTIEIENNQIKELVTNIKQIIENNSNSSASSLIILDTYVKPIESLKNQIIKSLNWFKSHFEKVNTLINSVRGNIQFKQLSLEFKSSHATNLEISNQNELEKLINEQRGLILRFHMVTNHHKRINERNGFYDIENPYSNDTDQFKLNQNLHFCTVVDSIKDDNGRIKYLVLKNTWGKENKLTDNGYIYLSLNYLKAYAKELYLAQVSIQ